MTVTEDLRFVLPGQWLSLDVRGPDEVVAKRVHDLAERTLGKRDDLAQVRRSVREALLEAAAQARIIKADYLHLAQSIMDGIPLSATLTVSRPGISLPVLVSRAEELQALLALVPGDEPTAVDHPELVVVRSVDRIESSEDSNGAAVVQRLTANYWIQVPNTGRLVVFSFSSSMPNLDDELMLLFEAIASSVHLRAG